MKTNRERFEERSMEGSELVLMPVGSVQVMCEL